MKYLLLVCSALLIIALAKLPIGYNILLRITVTIGAIAIVVREFENGVNFWVLSFGLIAILFNPLIPVYLYDKDIWFTIDIVVAILFLIKSFSYKISTDE